jgi:hypothetical protein
MAEMYEATRRESELPHWRPRLREPYPVRAGAVLVGGLTGGLWMLAFGLLATTLAGYLWWSLASGLVAWAVAALLARYGDRGVAVGLAAVTGMSWTAPTVALIMNL